MSNTFLRVPLFLILYIFYQSPNYHLFIYLSITYLAIIYMHHLSISIPTYYLFFFFCHLTTYFSLTSLLDSLLPKLFFQSYFLGHFGKSLGFLAGSDSAVQSVMGMLPGAQSFQQPPRRAFLKATRAARRA